MSGAGGQSVSGREYDQCQLSGCSRIERVEAWVEEDVDGRVSGK